MTLQFGRSIRPLWELSADVAFLNHGSFGACPKSVLAEQGRLRLEMEAQPDLFFRQGVMPGAGRNRLRAAAASLGTLVNAREAEMAFVENATAGIQAVLGSIDLRAGDQILITDHTYNAVRLMVEARCAETGATPLVVRLPIPTSAEEILAAFETALTPAVKLAIVDHITSPTALVLPLEQIIALLRKWNALVLVDGAHAVGQIPLDLAAMQCDWYVSNTHKWLFSPKGSAFLYASPEVAPTTRPNIVSHFIEMGFPCSFDWTGTRDHSGSLAVPAAMDFFTQLDPDAASAYQRRLLDECAEILGAIGAKVIAPASMTAAMRSFELPQRRAATEEDAQALVGALWEKERIQAMAVMFQARLLLRVSAQVYVDEDDIRRLGEALHRHGWPGQ